MSLAISPIATDPEILGGAVVFRGTRVPVQTLVDYLADGFDVDDFITFFPSVRKDDVVEFLRVLDRKES